MRPFGKILYGLFVSVILLLCLGNDGCEQQMQQIDKAAEVTKQITIEGEQVLESPVGQYVPPDIKFWVVLGGALASGLANAWQEWRNQNMKKTTKAIVKGIEKAERSETNPPLATAGIKAAIAEEMKAAKIYDRGNKIVDKLKIA